MKKRKVLIIKPGYSEILDGKTNSRIVSLGDVLRTTPLLHLYHNEQVTWVTDPQAFPLLEHNPLIHRLLPFDFLTASQLTAEEFDFVINLEKIPGVCALSDSVRARKARYGFTFNTQTGEAEPYDRAYDVLAVSANTAAKKQNNRPVQELLFEMVGAKWNGEELSLGYKPRTAEKFDVALNTQVGRKWPIKAWPNEHWDFLEKKLVQEGMKVTRQDELKDGIRVNKFTNLESYMDWIHSARIIVTNDSLGLHLGIAMKKDVLGLFGPTLGSEICFYNRGEAIVSDSGCAYMPCFRAKCRLEESCMTDITPERVLEKVKHYNKRN